MDRAYTAAHAESHPVPVEFGVRLPLLVLLLAATATSSAAPTALALRWRLEEDVFPGSGPGTARAAFTLTNRDPRPLPARGWALYFNALHEPHQGSVGAGFRVERVTGDLQRLVPGGDFAGLAAGQSVEIEYRTSLLTNHSFAPVGPYVVLDDAPQVGHPVKDYEAAPFARGPQGEGRDPRRVTPEQQYALDSLVRDIPLAEVRAILPTPLRVEPGAGELRLAAMPAIEAPAELRAEAAFAADYLRAYFGKGPAAPSAAKLQLETGRIEGQSSPEAYALAVDPRRASASSEPRPRASSTACNRCAACCPRSRSRRRAWR